MLLGLAYVVGIRFGRVMVTVPELPVSEVRTQGPDTRLRLVAGMTIPASRGRIPPLFNVRLRLHRSEELTNAPGRHAPTGTGGGTVVYLLVDA